MMRRNERRMREKNNKQVRERQRKIRRGKREKEWRITSVRGRGGGEQRKRVEIGKTR